MVTDDGSMVTGDGSVMKLPPSRAAIAHETALLAREEAIERMRRRREERETERMRCWREAILVSARTTTASHTAGGDQWDIKNTPGDGWSGEDLDDDILLLARSRASALGAKSTISSRAHRSRAAQAWFTRRLAATSH